jgi:hypothetical protein
MGDWGVVVCVVGPKVRSEQYTIHPLHIIYMPHNQYISTHTPLVSVIQSIHLLHGWCFQLGMGYVTASTGPEGDAQQLLSQRSSLDLFVAASCSDTETRRCLNGQEICHLTMNPVRLYFDRGRKCTVFGAMAVG